MSSARFPVPAEYGGAPPPAEGLRQALAVSTEADLNTTMAMLTMGAKVAAGLGAGEQPTEPLEGTAALLAWLGALVAEEAARRDRLLLELEGHAGA